MTASTVAMLIGFGLGAYWGPALSRGWFRLADYGMREQARRARDRRAETAGQRPQGRDRRAETAGQETAGQETAGQETAGQETAGQETAGQRVAGVKGAEGRVTEVVTVWCGSCGGWVRGDHEHVAGRAQESDTPSHGWTVG